MRKTAWILLLLSAFAIPWEYSLDLGAPLGNVARILGLAVLLAAIPAVLERGSIRTPGSMQWMVLALFAWFCLSYFWTIDGAATLEKMRGYFQETMIVFLVWEFADDPRDLRNLLRVFVAGEWVLALLTLYNFSSPEAIAAGRMRFAAYGQDPNDVARFLDLGFPLAALLITSESRRWARGVAIGYMPLGLFAVLLTASRGGFVAAMAALAGCAILLGWGHKRAVLAAAMALPIAAAGLWLAIPHQIFERLATIPEQLHGGDLNQRLNIWATGWHAFREAPLAGTGAGTFVAAAGLAPLDTAHNTALSIAVGGGLCALMLASAIVAMAVIATLRTRGLLRVALVTSLAVWMITSLTATVEESRTTWLLLALTAIAGRLAVDDPEGLAGCFPAPTGQRARALAVGQTEQTQ